MVTVGLDLSLTKSGYAIVKDDGTVLASGVIKSKPVGDKPIDELRRIQKIVNDIKKVILPHEMDGEIELVAIEGLAFMARNTTALVQLSALNYMVRAMLADGKLPFVLVAPSSLKKFITQKGNADKNQMMMQVFKDYNFTSMDDNICDAYSLAVCGLALLGHPLRKITVPESEVLALLTKQL